MSLVIVFTATSEFQALTVRDLLQQNNVPAMLKSSVVPGYNFNVINPSIWGDVLVDEVNIERARELVVGFYGTLGELAEAEPLDMPGEG